MEDQFNGRTDDDLFADDFEPVAESASAPAATKQAVAPKKPTSAVEAPPKPVIKADEPAKEPPTAPKQLSQSRHNKPAPTARQQRKPSPKPPTVAPDAQEKAAAPGPAPAPVTAPLTAPVAAPAPAPASAPDATPAAETDPATAPTEPSASVPPPDAPKGPSTANKSSNTASVDRLASGANPRTKLTEAELSARMEQMRLLNAEKTRKFEQAEKDSRSHALAYERGMEELRKRKAEEAEKRKRGDEDRKRMNEEREKNRERKLKAMAGKDGGWDEGKVLEEQRGPSYRRGANGGIRGTISRGLGGSRFADDVDDAEAPPRELDAGEFRGRGRGRGRGGARGGGRGGRGAFNDGPGRRGDAHNGSEGSGKKQPDVALAKEDFPALPGGAKPQLDTAAATKPLDKLPSLSPGLNSPPVGKWDEEMEALDEQKS